MREDAKCRESADLVNPRDDRWVELQLRIMDVGVRSEAATWLQLITKDSELIVFGYSFFKMDTKVALITSESLTSVPGMREAHEGHKSGTPNKQSMGVTIGIVALATQMDLFAEAGGS